MKTRGGIENCVVL